MAGIRLSYGRKWVDAADQAVWWRSAVESTTQLTSLTLTMTVGNRFSFFGQREGRNGRMELMACFGSGATSRA
jgi:hypothetical protein